jgi:fucose 4-O-acetylase-like acetyltransferase
MTSQESTLAWEPPATVAVAAPTRRSARIQWLDVTKGIGILLVVAGHALGGMIDSPMGAKLAFLRYAFIAIYVFHMPLFFFLSGVLVQPRIERGKTGFFLGVLATVVYPYFLWSTIQYSAIYAAGSLVNRPVTVFWQPILNLPFASISQFWYLYVLCLMHIAALFIVPRLGAKSFFGVAVLARLLVAVVAPPVMVRLALLHGVFYAAGVFVGAGGLERARAWIGRHGGAVPLILLLGAVAVAIATVGVVLQQGAALNSLRSFETSVLAWRLPLVPAAIAGASAVIVAAMLQRGTMAAVLAYLGQRSMAIFVLHVLFIAGTRILLGHIAHLPPLAVLALCAAAGLLLPLAVYEASRRVTRSRFLGLG